MQASKVIIKTTYDVKINHILLFNIVGFTHLNLFGMPHCLITKLLKYDFGKVFCHAVLKFLLKLVWVALCHKSQKT